MLKLLFYKPSFLWFSSQTWCLENFESLFLIKDLHYLSLLINRTNQESMFAVIVVLVSSGHHTTEITTEITTVIFKPYWIIFYIIPNLNVYLFRERFFRIVLQKLYFSFGFLFLFLLLFFYVKFFQPNFIYSNLCILNNWNLILIPSYVLLS